MRDGGAWKDTIKNREERIREEKDLIEEEVSGRMKDRSGGIDENEDIFEEKVKENTCNEYINKCSNNA